jgi:signal transduction histidine kinase
MRVLAVDDDAVARMAMQGMVSSLGHECLLARNGEEAWNRLREAPFDVLITDRVMPDMDGLELCRKIRADAVPGAAYLYVILASALGEEDHARDGMVAGADDYLAKPLRRPQLELKLIAAERVTRLSRDLARTTAALRETILQDAETNRRLIAANELQADMMAMLSHDARQPLAAVIGLVEATVEEWAGSPDEMKLRNLQRAAGAARRLDELIEDVLTMGNLDAGTISARPRAVLVRQTVQEAIVAAGDPAVEVGGDLDAEAFVDPWHLRQILTNLVANAVKYGTAPFSVTIHAAAPAPGEESSPERELRIEVQDDGEGVPTDFVPRLFDRFARAETGIATQKQGTGFGLYIVQQLTQVNGGRIDYRPGRPRGACFVVTLPAVIS